MKKKKERGLTLIENTAEFSIPKGVANSNSRSD